MKFNLHVGDSEQKLKEFPDNHFDSIVTDPPYGIGFMGKGWDKGVPPVAIWLECLRVLKPGGYLLAFAGTRTQHRMAVNIEDAGFEIRDMIGWMYGSGFPKSHSISKAIDKAAGADREVVMVPTKKGNLPSQAGSIALGANGMTDISAPATPDAIKWSGFGSALKPAFEPITVARKPLSEKTIAANVLKWGTGGINIDGCRVGTEPVPSHHGTNGAEGHTMGARNEYVKGSAGESFNTLGRFPANIILTYPEDEYILNDGLTKAERAELFQWLLENGDE